jgi:hypothetical protein
MKYLLILFAVMISGCASNDYAVYVEAQKSLSRDRTVTEAARLSAIIEMTKSADPTVKSLGLLMLNQLQHSDKQVNIEPPKKNWIGL